MTTYLRVQNGIAVESWTAPDGETPSTCFAPALAATFFPATGGATVGWTYANGTWSAPIPTMPTVVQLIAYANGKQLLVLAALAVTYALKDGSSTLTTMCDDGSMTFLNSLAAWANMNAAASPVPTRVYYNLDGSAHALTPTDMAEFLTFVGSRVQATFDALAVVRSAIGSASPTITTTAEIDKYAWPTS